MSNYKLKIELCTYIPFQKKWLSDEIETEEHLLLPCSFYNHLRYKHIEKMLFLIHNFRKLSQHN